MAMPVVYLLEMVKIEHCYNRMMRQSLTASMLFGDFRIGQRMFQQSGQAIPRRQLVQLFGPITANFGRLYQDPVGNGFGEKIIAALGQGIKLELTIFFRGQENNV